MPIVARKDNVDESSLALVDSTKLHILCLVMLLSGGGHGLTQVDVVTGDDAPSAAGDLLSFVLSIHRSAN